MICKHGYIDQNKNEKGWNEIYCNETKEKCNLVRFCERVNNLINIDDIENKCKIAINIKDLEYLHYGDCKVLFCMNEKLYVQIDKDTVTRVDNIFGDNVPLGVNVELKDGEYVIKQ